MRIRLFLLLFVFISCGTRNLSQNNKIMISNVNRPNWTEDNCTTPKEQNKYRICVGRAGSKRSEAEAIRSAKSNAYEEILESFGAQVADKYEEHKRTKDGKTEISIVDEKTSITSAPMWVEGEEIGSFSDIDNSGYKAWFRMSITQKEFERIKTEVEKFKKKVAEQNRVNELMANGLTVCSLKSNVSECANVLQLLPPVDVNGRKLRIPNKCMDIDKSVDEISKEFNDVAYLMKIECEYREPNMSPATLGFIYSQINLKIDIVNVFDGTNVLSINAQREGGGYSLKDSIEDAVEEAVEELKDKYKENFE